MSTFKKVILYSDQTGRSRFREETIELTEGTSQIRKSSPVPCKTYRLRHSPVGFSYDFHYSDTPLWAVILQGHMEITLQHGISRLF